MAKKKADIIDRYIAFIKKILKERGDDGVEKKLKLERRIYEKVVSSITGTDVAGKHRIYRK